jgi:hypothetical protein
VLHRHLVGLNRAFDCVAVVVFWEQVCCRDVVATGLPIIATAATLLAGTHFSAFSLFEAHQHEFSLSVQLIMRDEWGGERRKALLDRVRLPRGKHVGKMSTAIKPQYRRDKIQAAVEMDATAADRRKLAQGARTLLLDDLVRIAQTAEARRCVAAVGQARILRMRGADLTYISWL